MPRPPKSVVVNGVAYLLNNKATLQRFKGKAKLAVSRRPKVNVNERKKLLENYRINSAEKRTTIEGFSKTNSEVGITEYVFCDQSFPAEQSRSRSDFQVKPVEAHLLGKLKDHYNIALRKVIGDQCHVEICLKSLKDVGFINYYENEAFGQLGNQHLIGKELVLERWQEVIDLILEQWLGSKSKPSNLALACFEYISSRDASKAVSIIDEHQMNSIAAKLLSSIKLHSDNLAEALDAVTFSKSRKSYFHAYQCFIWNKIVSKRIAKFGLKLIVGDLVYDPQHNLFIFIDENNIQNHTIYDIVLPLPRHDTVYPANEIAIWYNDLFQEDGISEEDFNLSSKTYGLLGLEPVYRPIMLRPSNLKWKFVRYDDSRQKLILSNLDRLQQIELPLVGAHLGVVLEFDLPASGFASMALREILKMEMKKETIEIPTPLLELNQNRPAANDLQIKETNGNLCPIKTISELPVSEIENCGLDSPSTSGLCQASPPRKIKLESGALDKHLSMDSPLEQLIPCPPSINESPPKESPLEKMDTIKNLQPATKKRSNRSHPPFLEMIIKAVIALKELNGSSRQAILQYILANFHVGIDSKSANLCLKQALKRGVTLGTLEQIGGGKGAAGSFRLSAEAPKKVDKKVELVAANKEPKMVKKAACPKKAKALKKAPAAATRKQTKKTQVKKEPAANEQPAAITKDSSEELQKNRIIVESSPSNQMPQLIKNECFDETQTKCVKEEPGINRTRPSTLIESCAEEPAEKKVKADPEAKQKEFPSKVSKFKSIIYVDLSSDEEN